jgi:hypothetical protein
MASAQSSTQSAEDQLPVAAQPIREPQITPDNPKGYPPFDIAKFPSYTNSQIRYYLRTGQLGGDITALQKAKKLRDDMLKITDWDGESDYEGAEPIGPPLPPPPLSSSARIELSLSDDSETDDEFTAADPGEKGLKTDKITLLERNGGLVNFKTWLMDLETAFISDRARFTTAPKRVALASFHMDSEMKALWTGQLVTRPYLRHHWRKFLRWVERAHLHGEADRTKYLQQYHEAVQGEDEEPAAFYTRLSLLATAIGRGVTVDDLFPRLVKGLRNTLTRNARKASTVDELMEHAQEVWATFTPSSKKRKRDEGSSANNADSNRPNQPGQSQGRPAKRYPPHQSSPRVPAPEPRRTDNDRLAPEELERRKNQNLCFRCGKPGHIAIGCSQDRTTEPTKAQPVTRGHRSGPNRGNFKRNPTTRINHATAADASDMEDGESDDLGDGPSATKYAKNN